MVDENKHSLYSAGLTDEEREMSPELLLGTVDEELRILRLRLRRTFIAQRQCDERELAGRGKEQLPLFEVVRKGPAGAATPKAPGFQEVRKLPPFDDIIYRTIGRIGALERIRAELGGGQTDHFAAARKIKEALAAMDDSVPPPDDADGNADEADADVVDADNDAADTALDDP